MFGRNFKKELKKLDHPLGNEALVVINKLEEQMRIMQEKYDVHSWISETKRLNTTIETQQEAVNAATKIIDDLRMENKLLKANLYTRELDKELTKYKKLLQDANDNYQRLCERYNLLMSEYVKR